MLKLIQIELKKIFHKKSIYIIFILMTLFCFLNNLLYKLDYNEEGFYKYYPKENIQKEINKLEQKLKKYNKENNKVTFINIKTKIDILTLKKQFKENTWQYNLINKYLYDITYQKNLYQSDLDIYPKINEEYLKRLKKLKQDDWKYFLKEKIDNSITSNQEESKIEKEILEYRIKNNIKIEQSYLNQALEELEENKKIIKNISKEDRITYNETLSKIKINEYILNHKQNINKENTLNYELRTISEDYEIFIILLILIVSSTIISEEFQKGTIKSLLIKPYSRVKILLSKYLTCFIILLLSLLFLIVIELIIGTYFLGYNSMNLPVVIYNIAKKEVVEYSIWTYMLIRITSRLPFFIMLLTISFTLSTISTSSVLSISIPLMITLLENMVYNLITTYHQNWLCYFINMNWHFENYLFGQISIVPNLNFKVSLIIWLIYFIILMIITIQYFKKKNIKNI